MTVIAVTSVFVDAAHAAAGVALLLPLAVITARAAQARRDPAIMLAAGIAGAFCILVVSGLVLASFSGATAAGWFIAVGALDLGIGLYWLAVHSRTSDVRVHSEWQRSQLQAPRPLRLAFGLLALALTIGAVLFSSASARRQAAESHFTQLWMLETVRSGHATAHVGVANREGRSMSYRLVIAQRGRVLYSRSLRLARNGSWTTDFRIPTTPVRTIVRATLFRAKDREPYRATNLWTPIT